MLGGVPLDDLVQVVGGDAKQEAIVGQRFGGGQLVFVGPKFECERIGTGVGHLDKGGDSTGDGCLTFACQVCLVRQSGITKVYLSVDHSRKQVLAATIHDLVLVLSRDGTDFLDAFPFN